MSDAAIKAETEIYAKEAAQVSQQRMAMTGAIPV